MRITTKPCFKTAFMCLFLHQTLQIVRWRLRHYHVSLALLEVMRWGETVKKDFDSVYDSVMAATLPTPQWLRGTIGMGCIASSSYTSVIKLHDLVWAALFRLAAWDTFMLLNSLVSWPAWYVGMWLLDGDVWLLDGDVWLLDGDVWLLDGDVWLLDGDVWLLDGDVWLLDGDVAGRGELWADVPWNVTGQFSCGMDASQFCFSIGTKLLCCDLVAYQFWCGMDAKMVFRGI